MNQQTRYLINQWATAAVWAANGLVCKVLGLLPRHEQIVARILGPAQTFTGRELPYLH